MLNPNSAFLATGVQAGGLALGYCTNITPMTTSGYHSVDNGMCQGFPWMLGRAAGTLLLAHYCAAGTLLCGVVWTGLCYDSCCASVFMPSKQNWAMRLVVLETCQIGKDELLSLKLLHTHICTRAHPHTQSVPQKGLLATIFPTLVIFQIELPLPRYPGPIK